MFLVIFGAGASFDSVPERFWSLEMVSNRDLRPPLAVQLFEPRGYYVDRIGSFPYCPEIVAELRGAIVAGRNIEDEIERFVLWGEGGHERAQRQVMALRFYLQAIITGSRTWGSMARSATNYAALFSRIERWREPRNEPVQVVTFNYDLLLEDALRTFRDDFDAIHQYPAGDKYNVYKLHGSTNWEHLVRLSRDYGHPAQLIEDAPVLEISQDIVVEGQVQDMAAIPAIAVPTTTKAVFECPDLHVRRLQEMLSNVDRVLLVGWKAQEQTFLELLRESLPNVRGLVVDRDAPSADVVANVLRAGVPQGVFEPANVGGFSELVGSAPLEALLENA